MKPPLPPPILLPPLLLSLALLGLWLGRPGEPPDPPSLPPAGTDFFWGEGGGDTEQREDGATTRGGTTRRAPPRRHPLQPPYPHPYRFLLNQPHKCRGPGGPPFLVLLVASQPGDMAGRAAIRQTWGNQSSVEGVTLLRLFLLGVHPVFGRELGGPLAEESRLHGDLLQQDFLDTYNNLTLKTLMGLQWVSSHCPAATYVVKADADVFLNLGYLVRRFLLPPKKDFITGYVYRNTRPIRQPNYKWYVPPEVYPNDTYPPYCGGPGYVLSGDLATKIYRVAQRLPLINMEDSFVGICLHALGVAVTPSPPGVFNMYRVGYQKCRFSRLVMVHHYGPKDLLAIWPDFQETKCPP